MRKIFISVTIAVALSGCVAGPVQSPTQTVNRASSGLSLETFSRTLALVEPVAEQECRQRTPRLDCDFKIVLDQNPRSPANAYQSIDESGRPVLTFTQTLLAELANDDELAFIIGHEAAHHISGHLPQKKQDALTGALVGTVFGAVLGADAVGIDQLQNLGASVGARRYSKEFELEADALGTVITTRAGFDPIRGSAYFNRAPDPGDQFLGSHPPNAQRIEIVRQTAAGL